MVQHAVWSADVVGLVWNVQWVLGTDYRLSSVGVEVQEIVT